MRPGVLLACLVAASCGPKAVKPPADDGPPPAFGGTEIFQHGPTLTQESATVTFDFARRSLAGESTLTIRDDGVREFPIVFDAHVDGVGGFELQELSQDGVPCRWEVYGAQQKVVVVRIPAPAKTVTLHLRWKGSPTPGIGRGFLLPDEALLLDIEGWLPFLPATSADVDFTARWPESFEMVLEGVKSPAKKIGHGLVESRTHFHTNSGTTVFAIPKYAMKRLDLGGTPAVIAVPPAMAETLPLLEEKLRAAWTALSPLGPLPEAELRVVHATMTQGNVEAFGGRSFIAFRDSNLDLQVLTHELAHSWFGGTIFAATVDDDVLGRKRVRTELWPESLAEYASTWTMKDDLPLREHRARWLSSYASGYGEAVVLGRTVASYTRAPLLLAGIEHRVGRPKMQAALAAFVKKKRGELAEWKDVADAIATVAGEGEAADLLAWIDHPGAPDLALRDLSIEDGTLSATLSQHSEFVYPGTLEVGFLAQPFDEPAKKLLSTQSIAFRAGEVAVKIRIPEGAKTLVLDPEIYLPRTLGRDPTEPGILVVPLDRDLRPRSNWFLTPP